MVLKAYAEKYGITDMDWNLLTGDTEKIYELANVGFNILLPLLRMYQEDLNIPVFLRL